MTTTPKRLGYKPAPFPTVDEADARYFSKEFRNISNAINDLGSTVPGGAALTKTNDTNVTLTLGGSPLTALVNAASLTLGWTGLLGLARGGLNADLSATGGVSQVLKQLTTGAAITVGQLAASDLSNGVTGSGAVVLANAPTLTGLLTAASATFSGVTQVTNPTSSTSSSSGALTVGGGLGVGENIFAAGKGTFTLALTSKTSIGYSASGFGTGGTVTQATSKTTAVTLNNICGQITVNNAAMTSMTSATFTVNNSTVAATDTIVAVIGSYGSGASGNYVVSPTKVTNGSFDITILALVNGSDAFTINFAVIKAVAS